MRNGCRCCFWTIGRDFEGKDMDDCPRCAYIGVNRVDLCLALVLEPAGSGIFRRIGL